MNQAIESPFAQKKAGVDEVSLGSYTKDGKDYLLMANSKHGILKLPTTEFATATPITAKTGPAGIKAESIKELTDVVQLDKLDAAHALILTKSGDLKTVPLP